MPDPIIGGAVVKAAVQATESSAKQAMPGLMSRVLGPSADEIGDVAKLWTAYKLRNVRRIIAAAERKADEKHSEDPIHPRVAHQVLDNGSYCDDELMAEYYGGLLAAAKTPTGRDDRAVSWSSIVTGMSALQIRAHYLLYREWAIRLRGKSLNLGVQTDRTRARMDLDLNEFTPILGNDSDLGVNILLNDAIVGLARIGLLHNDYLFGSRGADNAPESPYENLLRVMVTPSGLELYGWAQGSPGILPGKFTEEAVAFAMEPPIVRLTKVTMTLLDAQGPDPNSPGTSGVTP